MIIYQVLIHRGKDTFEAVSKRCKTLAEAMSIRATLMPGPLVIGKYEQDAQGLVHYICDVNL